MQPIEKESERWIMMKDAHEKVGCARSTIYKWVKGGKVRSMRPGKELWLYIPDLLKAEAESVRRVGV